MHLHHDHVGGHGHDHSHEHTHEHTHDGVAHSHPHTHAHEHAQGADRIHDHDRLHAEGIPHDHEHAEGCTGNCSGCGAHCEHTPMEELTALMKYMASHNAAHAQELAELAKQLQKAGNLMAYEQVMAAVSDFEKGNMRLSLVLASLEG